MTSTPWDARWHLRAELARIVEELGCFLARQRRRGRTSAGDPVHGLVIEDGEAEGLLDDLAADLSPAAGGGETLSSTSRRREGPTRREEIADRATMGAAHGAFLPLRHAASAFELEPVEYDAFLVTLSVETDPRLGRLVAYLNDHVNRTRPTIGLALSLTTGGEGATLSPLDLCERPIVRDGLLELEGDGPLPGLALRVPRDLLARVLDHDSESGTEPASVQLHPPERGLLDRLVLEDSLRMRLAAWGEAKRQAREAPPVILHGAPGSGRTTAARAAASEAGLPLVAVEVSADGLAERLRTARREARWNGAALLLRVTEESRASPSPVPFDWSLLWAGVSDSSRGLFVSVESRSLQSAASAARREPSVLLVDEPDLQRRAGLWRALLPAGSRLEEAELTDLAGRFRFNPRRTARAVQRAVAELTLAPPGDRRLSLQKLESACRAMGSSAMGPLAQKLSLPYQRHELVVPAHVQTELDLAIAWVRHRYRVLEEWGFGRRIPTGRGLTALLSGEPGVGKTMMAQVLARELGLDLFLVDLSKVMSKYIGETEKHLAALFDEAYASGAILFFDEAETLFSRRTDVKQANDAFHNVEIGYLLYRMEQHDGVTVLATNRMRDMDEAFVRRFHLMAEIPMPSEAERLRIWEGMFPDSAARVPDLDFRSLARDFEVSGGEIKNAVLAAAYLAATEGKPIGLDHLKRALKRELIKGGKVVDEGELSRAE